MIDRALEIIAQELGIFIESRLPRMERSQVILSELLNQDGSPKTFNEDTITITLVNIEEEKAIRNNKASNGVNRPIHLNLYLLFTAFHGENSPYLNAVQGISATLGFLQSHNILDHQNTPDLDPNLEKLSFELVNQTMQTLNYTWSMQGNRYLPSILYKARMVVIQEGLLQYSVGRVMGSAF